MGVWIYGGPVTHHEQRLALELVCVVAANAAAFDHFGRFLFLVILKRFFIALFVLSFGMVYSFSGNFLLLGSAGFVFPPEAGFAMTGFLMPGFWIKYR